MKDNRVEINIDKLKLLSDHVLVIAVTIKETKGLVNPDQYEDKNEFGQVVKVGINADVSESSIILFGKYSTVNLTIDGVDYLLIRNEDIIAVLEE